MARRSSAALRVADTEHVEHLDNVRSFVETLKTKFLECRDFGHQMQPHTVGHHPDGGFRRTMICRRCKTRKVEHLSSAGVNMNNTHYIYPEGYLTEGVGRLYADGRGIIRIESMKRLFTYEEEEIS